MSDDARTRGQTPKPAPPALHRRVSALEKETQLDLFRDCSAQAAKARAELDEIMSKRRRMHDDR